MANQIYGFSQNSIQQSMLKWEVWETKPFNKELQKHETSCVSKLEGFINM